MENLELKNIIKNSLGHAKEITKLSPLRVFIVPKHKDDATDPLLVRHEVVVDSPVLYGFH